MIFCFALIIVVFSIIAFSACNSIKKDNTIKDGILKVAVENNSFPWLFSNEAGKLSGINVAYFNKLCKDAGYEVEFVAMDFNNIIDAISNHEVDMSIDNIKVTDERKDKVNFTDSYNSEGVDLYIPQKSGLNLDSFREKSKSSQLKVALQDGTYYDPKTDQLDNVIVVKYTSINEIIKALLNGEVDAAADISDSPLYKNVCECNNFPLENGNKKDVAIAYNKDIKNVQDKLNKAIARESEDKYLEKVIEYYTNVDNMSNWNNPAPKDL